MIRAGDVQITHDQMERRPGSWWHVGVFGQPDHIRGTAVCCPLCGRKATLQDPPHGAARSDGTRGHSIDTDGTVTPSIVCPWDGCTWHVWGRLLGWTP